LDRYADVLLWGLKHPQWQVQKKTLCSYGTIYRPNPLAEMVYAKLLDRGMNPVLRVNLTSAMERNFFKLANNNQIVFQPPGEEELFKN